MTAAGSGYGYTDGAHKQASSHVRLVAGQLDQELKLLASKLDGMQSQWTGTAATSFHSLRTRWSDDTVRLNQTLGRIADLLDTSGAKYDGQEQESQQTFSRIMSGLGGM